MTKVHLSFLILLAGSVSLAKPKPDEKKDRVILKQLSDEEHYENEKHNVDYDHEAFLGEEAHAFDQLSPEESKRRLGLIVDKIDKDKDGYVTQDELKSWIHYTHKKYIQDDVDNQWKVHMTDGTHKLTWETYKKGVYGFIEDMDPKDLEKDDNGVSYAQMVRRDRRRWGLADEDGDDALTKEEFTGFLHPEEFPHMRDVIIVETMEDIDKNEDGKVSLEEYIEIAALIRNKAEVYKEFGDMYRGGVGEHEPEWVTNEKEQFSKFRDKDGDGFMDLEEVKSWIVPPEFDHAEAEARHLIFEADSDSDQKLTKSEILSKYDLFVGSQATDFGEALTRHDEF